MVLHTLYSAKHCAFACVSAFFELLTHQSSGTSDVETSESLRRLGRFFAKTSLPPLPFSPCFQLGYSAILRWLVGAPAAYGLSFGHRCAGGDAQLSWRQPCTTSSATAPPVPSPAKPMWDPSRGELSTCPSPPPYGCGSTGFAPNRLRTDHFAVATGSVCSTLSAPPPAARWTGACAPDFSPPLRPLRYASGSSERSREIGSPSLTSQRLH